MLHENLANLRKINKYSQEFVAEKIGVSMLEDGIRYDKLASRRGIQMY